MYKLTLKIDQLPNSLNRELRTCRYQRNGQNRRWDHLIFCLVQGKTPEKPLNRAEIKITRHFWRMLDFDGLVSAKVLIDDNWNVTGKWDVNQEFRKKKDGPLLEIEVIEILPGL